MAKKIVSVIVWIMVVGLCALWYSVFISDAKDLSWIYKWFLDVVANIDDEIRDNSVWCGSFQIALQDLEDSVKASKSDTASSYHTFSADQMSETDYYNKSGLLSFDLKSQIEQWVKKQFNEVVDEKSFEMDWAIVPQNDEYYIWSKEKRYWVYSKFKKIISFKNIFDTLDNWNFADVYDDVRYFGIKCNSNKQHNQVKMLYYNTDSDFAVSIETQWWDEIILAKWTKWKTFLDVYNQVLIKERRFQWNQNITRYECLAIPDITLKYEKELHRLRNHKIASLEGESHKIARAIQGLELRLANFPPINYGNNGNTVQLTEVMWTKNHYLYFNSPFVIFIKEHDKELPYFAAQISDIKLFQ